MLCRTPIFLQASAELWPGVTLFDVAQLGAARGRAEWIQGALVVAAAEAESNGRRDRWLRAISVSVVTEADQLAASV